MASRPVERQDHAAPSSDHPVDGRFAVARAELEAMRVFLAERRPSSGPEALDLLRRAFPAAPLAERVKVATEARAIRFG